MVGWSLNNIVGYKEVTVIRLEVVTHLVEGERTAIKMLVTIVTVEIWTGELQNTSVSVIRSSWVLTQVVLLQTGISSDNLWGHEFQNIPQFSWCLSETLLQAFQLTHYLLFLNMRPPPPNLIENEIMSRKVHSPVWIKMKLCPGKCTVL
jgi:hypothetical protein